MVGQSDHLVGVVCGFMNDGQVEKPERKPGRKGCLFKKFKKKKKTQEKETVPTERQRTKPENMSVSQHRTFAGLFPPVVV